MHKQRTTVIIGESSIRVVPIGLEWQLIVAITHTQILHMPNHDLHHEPHNGYKILLYTFLIELSKICFTNLFYKICKFRSLKYRFKINNNYMHGISKHNQILERNLPHRVSLFHLLETTLERLFVKLRETYTSMEKINFTVFPERTTNTKTLMCFPIYTRPPRW